MAHQRIPAEIWGTIFADLCLSLHEYSFEIARGHPASPRLTLPLMIICQVSSSWRTIAKETSSLWSSVKVNLDKITSHTIDLLRIYLSRSREYPLRIKIEGTLDRSSHWGFEAWNLLFEHIHRSRELTMSIKDAPSFSYLRPIPRLSFPNLESYSEKIPLPGPRNWPWYWKAIQKAPKLTQVSAVFLRSKIPFAQLTTWVQGLQNTDDVTYFYDVVKRSRHLADLTLDFSKWHGPLWTSKIVQVELPFLRNFSIGVVTRNASMESDIFDSFIIPHLETCHICCNVWPPPRALETILQQSSAPLKRVSLSVATDIYMESYQDGHLLDLPDSLTHLELSFGKLGDSNSFYCTPIIDATVSTLLSRLENHSPLFLPNLSVFSFSTPFMTLNAQVVENVLRVVSARQSLKLCTLTNFRLMRFRVPSTAAAGIGWKLDSQPEFEIQPDMLERIRVLEEEHGVKVVIKDCFVPR
ncbi:hypothetical protein L218DRAFT_999099 [Marasmius fiardii PR-910]|nr:hypothetical protein L218DRAFT_999099 [Marasmius fiardii PR-910]